MSNDVQFLVGLIVTLILAATYFVLRTAPPGEKPPGEKRAAPYRNLDAVKLDGEGDELYVLDNDGSITAAALHEDSEDASEESEGVGGH